MLPPPFLAMDPADDLAWLAVADWLEENGEAERAELVRLTRLLRLEGNSADSSRREDRQMELLAAGIEPCVATVTNSIGMKLAYIPAGEFMMGSPQGEGYDDERPQHKVKITKAFYLGIHEVTQGQFKAVMGYNPSYFSRDGTKKPGAMYTINPAGGKDKIGTTDDPDDYPVENVSWEEANEFCEKLSRMAKEKEKNHLYRLPTEAEWEYSCRGGAVRYKRFHFGDELTSNLANFGKNLERTTTIGSYKANAFGLHDMHGNVWEWCSDSHVDYDKNDQENPIGPAEASDRVFRGGSWANWAKLCSAGYRSLDDLAYRDYYLGFRLLLCSVIE